jgi:REP element-mobilizing transposase RayT
MTLIRDINLAAASKKLLLPHSATVKAYLIQLSTYQRQPLLGYYQMGKLCLSDYGVIIADEWVRSAANRKGIELDQWVVTPDSIRGILFVQVTLSAVAGQRLGGNSISQKPWLLSSFIASFKAAAAKRVNLRRNQPGQPVWQRNYQEHPITDARALTRVREHLSEATSQPNQRGSA